MNIREVVKVLSSRGITDSEQVVRRWIRQGKLKATIRTKKEGYKIDKLDLANFIWKRTNDNNKGKADFLEEFERNRELEREVERLNSEVETLRQDKIKLLNESMQHIMGNLSTAQATNVSTLFGSEAETKKVFRELMKATHPDRRGNEEVFKKISGLYKESFK